MKTTHLYIFILIFIMARNVSSQPVTAIKGNVIDATTRAPIDRATIATENGTSSCTSDSNGNYSIFLSTNQPFKFKVTKDGFDPFETILSPSDRITMDVQLRRSVSRIDVFIDRIVSNSFIYGRVGNLDPQNYKQYKIVIYVLTNKWYIHPYAGNDPGKGYAPIREDGSWKIQTVWRNTQAYFVAALLVPRNFVPPPTIETSTEDAASDLLNRINPIASTIQSPGDVQI